MIDCPECGGIGMIVNKAMAAQDCCEECGGEGVIEAPIEEPDGDYEYERRRDAIMDRG